MKANDLPTNWQLKTLAQVCTSTSSNITFKNIQDKKGDYPIYGASGVVSYVDFYTKVNQSLGIVKDGAGIGRVFLLPPKASVIGTLHYIENNDDLNLKYLFYFLQSINLARYITGSAIPHIYFRDWKKEQIPIPPLEIQRRIVKRLDEAFSRIENGTKHLKSVKDNLSKYKQSLLKSAFNGTLTQDCPLSLGKSTHLTHPLAPSAREGEREGSPRARAGEQENCHALKSPLPQHEGHLGVGSTRTHKVVDCHESLRDSRNDENSSSFAGGQSSSPSLARGGGDSESSPSLAEGARGWVNPYNDDKDSLNGESNNLPQGWTIKTLGEVCEINPKNKLDDNLEVSFIPMNLILDKFQNKFSYETKIWKNIKKGYTHLQNNCIALAKITPCFENGKCVILDDLKNGYGAGTTEIIILLPNTQKVFIKYIFYFLNTQNFIEQGKRNFKGTAGQLRISTDFLSNCKIPIPPLEIQKQIVAILEGHFTSADKVSAYIDSCLSKAKQLKSSLLKSAFAGELT